MSDAAPGHRSETEYRHLTPLFAELATLPEGAERAAVRDQLITGYRPVAEHIAARFSHRGEPIDDLVQIAIVGLINAIDRFDPDRGVGFLTYAVPTVMGEVRRYFRDFGWSLRVPRSLKDLSLRISSATDKYAQERGRPPNARQLAEYLGVGLDEVLQGLEAAANYRPHSLDSTPTEETEGLALSERLGSEDADLVTAEQRAALEPLIAQLPQREQRILLLRFYGNLSQTQIAQRIGLSQMHVSRLLSRTLHQLRSQLEPD